MSPPFFFAMERVWLCGACEASTRLDSMVMRTDAFSWLQLVAKREEKDGTDTALPWWNRAPQPGLRALAIPVGTTTSHHMSMTSQVANRQGRGGTTGAVRPTLTAPASSNAGPLHFDL